VYGVDENQVHFDPESAVSLSRRMSSMVRSRKTQ
jgi:hypothetical protein